MSFFGPDLRNGLPIGLGSLAALAKTTGAGTGATLSFDFLSGALDPRITFTRASTARYFNSAGVLTSAAINEPRFDYNPTTLAARGLLIEEQRVNSIRNNTMQGAVAGTPGTRPTNWTYGQLTTLTTEIVSVGTETGISYVDIRISGTATTTPLVYFEANSTVAATNGQTWATSVFVKIVGGSTTNITVPTTTLRMSDSGGANLGFIPGAAITLPTSSAALAACRFSSTHTTNNASTAFVMPALAFNAAGAIDITLRIGLPQLEQGAFATSVIPTSGTALTRNADVASVNTLSPWYNATEGVLYSQYASVVSGTRAIVALDDNTANESIRLSTVSANPFFTVVDGGVTQCDIDAGSVVSNILYRFAGAYATNDFAACINGNTVQTDISGTLPSVDRLRLGVNQAGNYLNGYLQYFYFYPIRLSNAALQSLTDFDFDVLPSAGTPAYNVNNTVLSSGGTAYLVSGSVYTSNETEYLPT